jgi:hypothetical protein
MLSKRLRRLTVAEVCWLLKVYSAEHVEFCIKCQSGTIYATTADSIHQGWNWIKDADPACALTVRFWGGPAGQSGGYKRYDGTFVTLAIDRVLRSHQLYGLSYTWLLKFDGCSTQAIWKQLKTMVPAKLLRFAAPPEGRLGTEKQLTLFEDTIYDNPVIEHVQFKDMTIPIHEDGSQGYSMPRLDNYHPHSLGYGPSMTNDDGQVELWSSSGPTGVYM